MPVHFSPSSNRKEPTQLLQDELFPTSTFNKPHLSPTSQRKLGCFTSSRTLTLPGAINFYDMGWRLAQRVICSATTVHAMLKRLISRRSNLAIRHKVLLFKSIIRPVMCYGSQIRWHVSFEEITHADKLIFETNC
ncbi:hypothetical protein TNCV_893251 [Trichonephila clavipes]|nr:hypothetical protein TNCV_893251 [Trichonephila clavipes]